ncbi:asparagine--tRNA ligase [Thiotrichales bacterium 19S11-10]|nr:asparagine--tRNA ligase [Thiotrichales bacterium 19S11-10]MCF6806842.1 asparagine--tRNA ligase [Thiotrichales bacterium 19S9-11]MCF6810811.1 asparagine--tRNA ligase [Thiotrichales bacterium 19S9-12]
MTEEKKVYAVKTLLSDQTLVDQTVCIQGWVRTRRDSKAGISFISVHDGSCFDPIQAVVPDSLDNYSNEVLKLTKDCSVEIFGKLVPSQGGGQKVEIMADSVKVHGWIDNPETYPVSPKRHTVEHLRENAHLRVRTNLIGAVARVRHTLAQAIHQFLSNEGFYWVNTPIITTNDCEGAGEMFRVSTLTKQQLALNGSDKSNQVDDFFNQEVSLTVSGQLNVESYCLGLSKVYTFGPTFRAENSNTSRHLAEFWMLEPEVAFANLDDIANLSERMLKAVIAEVITVRSDDMTFFNQWVDKGVIDRLKSVIEKPFVKMDYTDAIEILKNADQKFEFPVQWGVDLQSEHERYLCETYAKAPVILMNYPKDIKAFYMRINDDGKTVAAMDVLVPGIGELIGGSQREERLDYLDQRLDEMEIDKEALWWYRDLRRYGTVAHSGFGLGFERLLSYITSVSNIRDVIPFPRTPGHAEF